jgi:hypothetical protein
MAQPDDSSTLISAVQHLETMAARLGGGSSEDHVRRSVAELSATLQSGGPVGPTVRRVMSSVRQLEEEALAGPRRHQQASMLPIERLLDALHREVLPALQRSGRL